MGDWYETVVDPVVSADDAAAVGEKVVGELVAAGLVKPVLTDCTLGESGFPPAHGVLRYLLEPDDLLLDLRTNGLEVVARRCPHLPISVERVVCPACRTPAADFESLRWCDAVDEWYEGGPGLLVCPACGDEASVAAWRHEPTCGFGNLAFKFWNWPPFLETYWTKTPVQMIESVVGHPCVVVSGKL